jgi:hypothetical protein
MSLNTAINAVIAHIEGQTDLVKEIFRGPNSDIKSIPEVVNRLNNAVDRAMAKGIREALVKTLDIQPDPKIANRDDFYAGVAVVEGRLIQMADALSGDWEPSEN